MEKGMLGKPLKDIIIELLGKDGRSINDLSKELEKVGIKKHRLILTGYLQALADMGILRERVIKPARVFSVQQSKKRSIYEIIGEKARMISEERASDITLYTLYKLFKRPIFMRELEKCGVGMPYYKEKVYGEERKKALQQLLQEGMNIPKNNSAYQPTQSYEEEYLQILWDLVVEAYNLKGYVNKEKHQMKLESL
ncbi:MAG: hypothetical protein J7J42_02195 [Thermoplasmata archaeon]|nr:hypothetical protein [Thermoplasmata archaeon]